MTETASLTRCFLLTPGGAGAIAVVRVVGPAAVDVVARIFQPAKGARDAALNPHHPQRLHYGNIIVESEMLDDVIVCTFVDQSHRVAVDINTHGGIRVVERLLMALQSHGVAVVSGDAASRGAWPASDRIDAEAIEAITTAGTRRAVEFLMHQRTALPDHLARLAALAERDASAARSELCQLLDQAQRGRFLVDGATIVVFGPPNAGKSTLANRLFCEPRSLVAPEAGTTRDWVSEPTALAGIPLTVVDTPGVGPMANPVDEQAVRRGMDRWAEADLALLVLDGSAALPEAFFECLTGTVRPETVMVLANKSDLPRRWRDQELEPLPGGPWRGVLGVSALNGDGLSLLERRIVERLEVEEGRDAHPSLFTQRQREVLARILDSETQAGAVLADRLRSELVQAS